MNATLPGHRITIATLLLLLACAHGAEAQKRLLFQGTVMGYDGKPMKDAHVEMWQYAWGNRWASTVEISVAPNGSFMTKLYPGLYTIQFAGVDHAFSEPRYLYIDSAMTRTVHARLARSGFLPLAAIDTVFAVCVDPTGGEERIVQAMRDLGGGRFEAQVTLPGTSTAVSRLLEMSPVLLYHIAGIVPERVVNGTEQDYYRYDGGGDFFSVKRIEDTVVTLHFDYNALTAVDRDIDDEGFRFDIDGEPLRHPYAMLARRKQAYRDAGAAAADCPLRTAAARSGSTTSNRACSPSARPTPPACLPTACASGSSRPTVLRPTWLSCARRATTSDERQKKACCFST
jgi:hypothetical protein